MPRRKPDGQPKPPPRPTKAQVEQRVAEVLAIRLAGAQFWDVKELIRERESARVNEEETPSPWQLADGQKPLSDGQIWRYIAKADKAIVSSILSSRKKALRHHQARREYLYGLAVNQGDVKAALACLRDEAELRGLYPPKGVKLTGANGGPIVLNIIEEVIGSKPHEPANTNSPASGAAGVPQE